MAGLPVPSQPAAQPMGMGSLGGALVQSVSAMQAQNAAQFQTEQAQPVIQNLAGHVKAFFTTAKAARLNVEMSMIEALYARRGEYTAEKRSKIEAAGQPLIYMMLGSTKMRQAESLLRDVLVGSGTEKPWTGNPSPVPELPKDEVEKIFQTVTSEVEQAITAGLEPTLEDIRQRLQAAKTELQERLREEAQVRCDRMVDKMEDQLIEGGFNEAFDEFITDLTTFKTAFIAGPIVRKKPKLTWGPDNQPVMSMVMKLEWERVDPFDMYPAPWARNISEGPMIRKHRLSRDKLNAMIGVPGYSESAIRSVLEMYGDRGLSDWLSIESQKAAAEGKNTWEATQNTDLIDALQYWGSVSGSMLRDWGMTPAQVPDAAKEYEIEAWAVGPHVIKAVLNADPLARRPYYATSYERIPGSVWGNSVYDLMKDCQDMCNATARSLAANLGIASGPQVSVNVDRLPPGAEVTSMYPWKIWPTTSDPMGGTQKAIDFFQPASNANELMGVFEKFSALADEYTGIPRYTVGQESTGGAGRTASGMSMMLGNASKIIKAVVSGVDMRLFTPLLERLYYYNMRFGDDPDLKGDVEFVARGALSLQTKEAAQQRRAEFLQATMNPVDLQIMGLEGRGELLRASASMLDMNTSKIVPPVAVLKDRQRIVQMQQQQAALAGQAPQGAQPAAGPKPNAPAQGPGQALMAPGGAAGAPVTDQFQPQGA